MKQSIRIIAMILAALMIITTLASGLAALVNAASAPVDVKVVIYQDGLEVSRPLNGYTKYSVGIYFTQTLTEAELKDAIKNVSVEVDGELSGVSEGRIALAGNGEDASRLVLYIDSVSYVENSDGFTAKTTITDAGGNEVYSLHFSESIPSKYYKDKGNSLGELGDSISTESIEICKAGTNEEITRVMKDKTTYALVIHYTEAISDIPSINDITGSLSSSEILTSSSSMLYRRGDAARGYSRLERTDSDDSDGYASFKLYIDNVIYNSDTEDLEVGIEKRNVDYTRYFSNLQVPSKYISGGGSNSNGGTSVPDSGGNDGGGTVTDDETTTVASQIVVENCIALDSAGNRIDVVTKDTPSFTLEIVFADIGLHDIDGGDIRAANMQAYITNAGGFQMTTGSKGNVVTASTDVDYPRFRATFTGVKWEGSDKNIGFTVFYLINEVEGSVKGEGSATLYSAKTEEEDEEKDEDKLGVAIPKIIVSQYSYGDAAIQAGNEFDLSFSVTNTSSETPLENVVVTLTPASNEAATKGPGLIVASSSNTLYVPALMAGATESYSVAFQARPDAEATSHLINIKFSYEYIDPQKKERIQVPDLSESIAIPVTQVDRFSVDPITDSVYGMVGEEAYVTINFVNKGKSTTNNVSASIKTDKSITVTSEHFGHLEAGSSDSLDLYLTGSEPGEFPGEVLVQYEDDNGDVKELSVPFTMVVEEQYFPPYDQEMGGMEDMEPQPPPGPGAITYALCAIGGIMIAVIIALYLVKRVKAKSSEDFDEAF